MIKIIKIHLIFSLLILILCFEPLQANDTRYYDVELILVENLRPLYRESEIWKKSIAHSKTEIYALLDQPNTEQILDDYDPEITFKSLENVDFRLTELIAHLNASKQHRIILHKGWRQPGMSKITALPIQIDHFIPDENIDAPWQVENSMVQTTNDSVQENVELEVPQNQGLLQDQEDDELNQIPGVRINGDIKLILSRYLHLNIDLSYQKIGQQQAEAFFELDNEPVDNDELADIYHLKQTRRLRSRELHYIDHPVISMIVLITPYIPPTIEQQEIPNNQL